MFGNSLVIEIEGLDGSGKETQSHLLCDTLRNRGYTVDILSFPRYGEASSYFVEQHLSGSYDNDLVVCNPYIVSAMYSLDRFQAFQELQDAGVDKQKHILILDRYVYSNAIYQRTKLPRDEWDSYLKWLEDWEFCKMGLPCPDSIIYLDTEVSTIKNILSVERRDKVGVAGDIYEKRLDTFVSLREEALDLASCLNWSVVSCTSNGKYRDRWAILSDMLNIVEPLLVNYSLAAS